MHGIVTVTLAPAIDKSTSIEQLVPEQKLSCQPPTYEPGGGGINVSRGLKRLGVTSTAVFPKGGAPGDLFTSLIAEEGITTCPVAVKNQTRENFIVVETSKNRQYRFGMPAPELSEGEERALLAELEKLSADFFVVSGSMPPGVSDDFIARLARLKKHSGARLVVDTSGEALREAVDEGIFLLKPNLGELGTLTGREKPGKDDVADATEALIGEGKCEIVVVSLGADGAFYRSKQASGFVEAPQVEKLSTVGAGDSMVAGMVYAFTHNWPVAEAVKFGVACGSAATMNAGTELFHKVDAEKLYRR